MPGFHSLTSRLDGVGGRVVAVFALLIAANLAAWAWALLAFRHHSLLLGTALLAYGLGARHAVDADHIAAIDNVTRKLMQQGRRPVGIGFYFALGHSSVVAIASTAVAGAAAAFEARFAALKEIGGILGTGVSALFLFAVALANLVVLREVYQRLKRIRRGEGDADLDNLLAARGLLGRFFRPLFRLVGASWHMYPLGILFGLGFDTASEIGLLGISAAEAANGLPVWSILVFPTLFAASMLLVDTGDGVLMLGAYGWALAKPLRKLYYNLAVTSVSVFVALAIGGIEILGFIAERLGAQSPFRRAIGALNENSTAIGCGVIGVFVASWVVSFAIYRLRGYHRIEMTPES